MSARTPPLLLGIVGRKHAGKTTLVVRLSAELTRRGHRVMTLKHGSHTFNLDPATTDTYRHFHEGNAERVAMASPDRFGFVQRWSEELPPEEIAARYLSDADLVLCEGFKASGMPKVEIHRAGAHAAPLWPDDAARPDTWRAFVTDAPPPNFRGMIFDLRRDDWLPQLSQWVEREVMR